MSYKNKLCEQLRSWSLRCTDIFSPTRSLPISILRLSCWHKPCQNWGCHPPLNTSQMSFCRSNAECYSQSPIAALCQVANDIRIANCQKKPEEHNCLTRRRARNPILFRALMLAQWIIDAPHAHQCIKTLI